MNEDQIRQVRCFNRTVTRRMGVLTDNYLGRGRPLGESRLLFEIGRAGADVRDLRTRLALDSGYLSRLLRALEQQGFLVTSCSPEDKRVRRVALTPKGVQEMATLDRGSREAAQSVLAPLGQRQRERLVAAMSEVERLMRASAVEIVEGDPDSAAARACIEHYVRELNERFEAGFDPARSVSAHADEMVPPRGQFLLAWLENEAVGCGGLKVTDSERGEIKRMWVAPSARGLGIAGRLLESLERQAIDMGLDVLQLDTNHALSEARALYARYGYEEIESYNDNPYADHWYEKRGLQSLANGPNPHR